MFAFRPEPASSFDAGPSPESTAGLLQEEGVSVSSVARGRITLSHNLRSRSAADQRGSLRTRRSQVQVLPGAPFPHVAQLEGGAPLRTETVRVQILPWGPFSPCSPTSRGAPLKTERLRVQIPPWGPLFAPVAQLAEAANLRSALCRCKSGLEHFLEHVPDKRAGTPC